MRQLIPLNRGWEFTEHPDHTFLHGGSAACTAVELPHTVRVTPLHYFDEQEYQMISGYRRILTLPPNAENKRIVLQIGAAAHLAEVYLDGERIAVHKGGYTAFSVDLSDRLTPGKDAVLAITADSRETLNIPPFGHIIDYMTYGGLYREVWLEITEKRCIADVFAVPSVPAEISTDGLAGADRISALTFTGTVVSQIDVIGADGLSLRQSVYKKGGEDQPPIAEQVFPVGSEYRLTVPSARLWDIESPALYTLRTELTDGERIIDRVSTVIGFRRSEFRADGYYLNGRRVKLRGLNRHQSYPYVGYAMPRSMQRYDAEILKYELGLNAVRTSHYPQSPHFIDRCDKLGLLVFTEIPGWQHIGGEEWKDTAVEMTKEMVRQYRNHPSIILWGVRINESRDDDAFYLRTNAAAHLLDPSRPTGGVRYLKKSHLLEDVYTYNDFLHDGKAPGCSPKKAVTPDRSKGYLISEYGGHMYPVKTFDNEELRTEHALRHVRVLDRVGAYPDIAGSFGWCFFDYNTHRDFGSGDRICYHGVCDMFRNPKLAAAVYASQQDASPVLSVSSDMNIGEHPASVRGRLFVFTNADSVRFYKNGVFIRSFTKQDSPFRHLPHPPIEITDSIGDRLEKGEAYTKRQAKYLKAILNDAARFGRSSLPARTKMKAAWLKLFCRMSADDVTALYGKYIESWGDSAAVFRFEGVKDGKVAVSVEKAACTARRMELKVSHTALTEGDTYDVAAIRIRLTDQNGNTLSCMNTAAHVTVQGPIELIGPASAPINGGMGGLYVRTVGQCGEASVTVTAEGTEPQTVSFRISQDR